MSRVDKLLLVSFNKYVFSSVAFHWHSVNQYYNCNWSFWTGYTTVIFSTVFFGNKIKKKVKHNMSHIFWNNHKITSIFLTNILILLSLKCQFTIIGMKPIWLQNIAFIMFWSSLFQIPLTRNVKKTFSGHKWRYNVGYWRKEDVMWRWEQPISTPIKL